MRTSIFIAVLQGVSGVLALNGAPYIGNTLAIKRSNHSNHGRCPRAGPDSVPNPDTIHLPHASGNNSNIEWDLCKHDSYCKPEHAWGKIHFNFTDDGLVFELTGLRGKGLNEVEIYAQTEEPPHEGSPEFGLKNCKPRNGGESWMCHLPYEKVIPGSSEKDLCGIDEQRPWIFYVQMRLVVAYGMDTFEVYSRGLKGSRSCWFSFGYCCTESSSVHQEPSHDKLPHEKPPHDNPPHDKPPHDTPGDECNDGDEKHGHHQQPTSKPNKPEPACEGGFLAVFGDHAESHSLSELAYNSHPDSCGGQQGNYNRFEACDLKQSAKGTLSFQGQPIGSYALGLTRDASDDEDAENTQMHVAIDFANSTHSITDISLFIQCDGGADDLDVSHPNICQPESYRWGAQDPSGINRLHFNYKDEFKCHGSYLFSAWLQVCA